VPDDHQVRAIASVLDLSWVYGELSATCGPNRLTDRDAKDLISTI
jgi:hypothetical protein